jgi:hypothetical protein
MSAARSPRSPRSLRPTHRHAGPLALRGSALRPSPTRVLPFPVPLSLAPARRRHIAGVPWAAAALLALSLARPVPLAAQSTVPPTTPPVPVVVPPVPVPVPIPVSVPASVPVVPAAPAVAILAYRTPALALAQPPGGGTVPADRPSVVFRFALGEPDDPLDTRSFLVAVDGHDRTALFQLSGSQAWGPLVPPSENGGVLTPGAHQLTARICSSRGACATVSATVTAVTDQTLSAATAAAPNATPTSRKTQLLNLLLSGAKRLIDRQ